VKQRGSFVGASVIDIDEFELRAGNLRCDLRQPPMRLTDYRGFVVARHDN
jgi:hypothetical protein